MLDRTRMRRLQRTGIATGALALLLGAPTAAPAAAGEVYSWVTEDGTHAFTDDPKRIPARYRDAAHVRSGRSLASYERFTPGTAEAAERHARGLAVRLESLRRLNGIPEAGAVPPPVVAVPAEAAGQTITLRPARGQGPSIQFDTGGGSQAPVVVEETRYRRDGGTVTGPALIVRQGDRTLAIVKERPRDTNVSRDIHRESDLEE